AGIQRSRSADGQYALGDDVAGANGTGGDSLRSGRAGEGQVVKAPNRAGDDVGAEVLGRLHVLLEGPPRANGVDSATGRAASHVALDLDIGRVAGVAKGTGRHGQVARRDQFIATHRPQAVGAGV